MDGDEVREDHRRERRGLTARYIVAAFLDYSTGLCRSRAGLDLKTETGNGNVALSCAAEFNFLAHLAFLLVVFKIAFGPVAVRRMRNTRVECNMLLAIGSICLLISLCFSAYIRWFVVG